MPVRPLEPGVKTARTTGIRLEFQNTDLRKAGVYHLERAIRTVVVYQQNCVHGPRLPQQCLQAFLKHDLAVVRDHHGTNPQNRLGLGGRL